MPPKSRNPFTPNLHPTPQKPLRLPGFGLPVNWIDPKYRINSNPCTGFPNAITDWAGDNLLLREFAMTSVMNELSDKPDWDRKIFDEDIVSKWRQEALNKGDFTDKMFDWCIAELRDQVPSFQKTGYVFVLPNAAAVVKSDTTVPEPLNAELREAVKPLEDVPDAQKDWHPNSGEKVLDLVHPSLYPLMYGKSRILAHERIPDVISSFDYFGKGEVILEPEKDEVELGRADLELGNGGSRVGMRWTRDNLTEGRYYSPDFQWLPCEVSFQETGDTTPAPTVEISSYINNLHPIIHRPLYDVLAKIIGKTIPLWDATLSYLSSENQQRISIECTDYEFPGGQTDRPPVPGEDPENSWELDEQWKRDHRVLIRPEPGEFVPRDPSAWKPVSLASTFKDDGLQVIVKLANIELAPGGKEEYEGGTWHVEGQLNEHVCASAIYYYAQENVTPSRLAFRQLTSNEDVLMMAYGQDDYSGAEELFGIKQGGPCVQKVGSVGTPEGRLITFPNVLQHQVQPFKLLDRSKPGYRKILALFLVDPYKRVISTANVPPQQRDWWLNAVHATADAQSRLGQLPLELMDKVTGELDWPISLREAKKVREELMKQRGNFVKAVNADYEFEGFSFCEH